MQNASYPKYKPNICRRSCQLLPSQPPGWQPRNRCRAQASAGTTPPQAKWPTPLSRAGSVPIEGLGQKLSGWTGLGGVGVVARGRLSGGSEAAAQGPRAQRRTWALKGNPGESVLPHPPLLAMLFRKTSSSSESGNSWIFQCLYFQPDDIGRTLNCALGTKARAFHVELPVTPDKKRLYYYPVSLVWLQRLQQLPGPLGPWTGTSVTSCAEKPPHEAFYGLKNAGEALAWRACSGGHLRRWSAGRDTSGMRAPALGWGGRT